MMSQNCVVHEEALFRLDVRGLLVFDDYGADTLIRHALPPSPARQTSTGDGSTEQYICAAEGCGYSRTPAFRVLYYAGYPSEPAHHSGFVRRVENHIPIHAHFEPYPMEKSAPRP